MKTFNKIAFLFFLSSLIVSITKINCSESKTSNTNKSNLKASTVVDLMKNFLGRTNKSDHDEQAPVDKARILTEKEKLSVTVEGWLKIQSPEFRNMDKFPAITLPDYSQKKILLSPDNFRINESYSEANKSNPDFPSDPKYFYFRISDKNIYYSTNKASVHVLGSLSLRRVLEVNPERKPSSTCLNISDQDNLQWKLCAENKTSRQKWICAIQTVLGIDDDECKSAPAENVVIQDTKVMDAVILIPLPAKVCNDGWNYKEQGKDWNCDCSEGKAQSPIDIKSANTTKSPVKPVFKYQEVEINMKNYAESPAKIEHSNGAVRIKYDSLGKVVTLDGSVYSAVEIVFHTPSQHKIDGRNSDLEVEIIHVGESKEVISQNLVLSILFDAKPGVYNRFFDDIDFFNLPNPLFKKRDLKTSFHLNKLLYNIDNDDYPIWKPFSLYTYEGSLTAPPCTERTIHYVKASPLPLGNTTIQLFREAIKVPDTIDAQGNITINTGEPMNFRETQPLNGRQVYYYDYVSNTMFGPQKKPKSKLTGHYEKMQQKMTQYFHVTSDKPSGLPGSFVISEKEAQGVIG